MIRLLIFILLVILIPVSWAQSFGIHPAQIAESGLTEQQAKQVLRSVLKHGKYGKILALRGAYIEDGFFDENGQQSDPGFYTFRLAYDSPKAGATDYFGPFVVSQKTGDVWDISLTSGCKNFHSPALTRLQATIMKKTKAAIENERPLRENFDCHFKD